MSEPPADRVAWLCRWPDGTQPPESLRPEASARGINGWLFTIDWHPNDPMPIPEPMQRLRDAPEDGPGYALAWRISAEMTPSEEESAAEQLVPWVGCAAARLGIGTPLLLIANLDRLSHPRFALPRLRASLARRLGGAIQLIGEGMSVMDASPEQRSCLDGWLPDPGTEPPCRLLEEGWDYHSHLASAHWHRPEQLAQIPVLVPPPGSNGAPYANATTELYQRWLAQSSAWVRLLALQRTNPGWLLIQHWEDHQRSLRGNGLAQQLKAGSSPQADALAPTPPLQQINIGEVDGQAPALVMHAYHLERFEEVLGELPRDQVQGWSLYVSTTEEQLASAEQLACRHGWQHVVILATENRGRDIGPFVDGLLPAVVRAGHPWAIKLHSKRSSHLKGGDDWWQSLRSSLASAAALKELSRVFEQSDGIGLAIPPGCWMPLGIHLNRNGGWMEEICAAQGIDPEWLLQQSFVAGSMFAFRPSCLTPLLRWRAGCAGFEQENGQRDGTLAHALERLVGASVATAGYGIHQLAGDGHAVPQFGYGWALPERTWT